MIRRMAVLAGAVAAVLLLSGHVGNNVEYLVGSAGPYPVQVVVRLPDVVPGQAQLSVQVDADDVTGVSVQPLYWRAVEYAPAPERARLIPGESRLWSTDVWLMARGAYGVRVIVSGERGEGEMMVPIVATATRTLEMQRALGITLSALGLFLVVGLLTIVRAASSDGLLPPGAEPDRKMRRRSWIVTGLATVVIALALVGGNAWWRSVDASYRLRIERPLAVTTTVEHTGQGGVLTLTITEPRFTEGTPLIPDHGKIMHMFLVREPALDVFAHLHPQRVDSTAFSAHLPPLPAGSYRLYADVVRASGFVHTLQDTVEMAAGADAAVARWLTDDPDASWYQGLPTSSTMTLGDGGTMTLRLAPEHPRAGEPSTITVEVRAPDGSPAALEPYLGMLGHAVVTRADGSLFVHLHPVGTVSMAAMEQFERRSRGDTALVAAAAVGAPASHAAHVGAPAHGVGFPFIFPTEGSHRVWIQVRRAGANLTGVFDVEVGSGR